VPSLRPYLDRLASLDRRLLAGAGSVFAAAIVVLVVVLGGVCGGGEAAPVPTPTATPRPTATSTPPPTQAALLDGVLIPVDEFQRLTQRLPLAIMIENHVDARPQFGLDRAELVYEAIAEGGITRLLAAYWRNDVDRIEPVRSARVYYVTWARELDAVYVHHGSSEEFGPAHVYSAINELGVRNLDGLFLGEAVGQRDPARRSPHNVVSSTGLLWGSAAERGWVGPPAVQTWAFKDGNPARAADPTARRAPAVDVFFSGSFNAYSVHWDYNPASNGYLRSLGGQPHTDAGSGQQLAAQNVAVQYATFRPSGDGKHNLYDIVGGGQAVVFQDGVAIEGTWSKPEALSRTRFYDAAGAEIAFNRGTTWVEVVPAGSPAQY